MEKKPIKTHKEEITFDKTIINGLDKAKQNIGEKYTVIEKIETNSSKILYLLENKITQDKRLCELYEKGKVNKEFEKVKDVLLKLDHPNIIKLYEIYENERYYFLVFERCSGEMIMNRITQRMEEEETYTELQAFGIFKQIIMALNYCYNEGICHRNLRPENIFFANKSSDAIKIGEFGLAKDLFKKGHSIDTTMSKNEGDFSYSAPEVIKGNYTIKCDVWSAGVILFLLLSGRKPFEGKNTEEEMKNIYKGAFVFPQNIWNNLTDEVKDLLNQMLSPEEKRISVKDIFNHPWFKLCEAVISGDQRKGMKNLYLSMKGLKHYTKSYNFRKMVFTYIADKLKESEVKEFNDLFMTIDKNHDGVISYPEFKSALKKSKISEENVKKIFQSMDTDNDQTVNYTEFIAAVLNLKKDLKEEYLQEAFNAFDFNHDGKINKKDLMNVLKIKAGDEKEKEVDEI
ncbi:MAG: protein kinase, partial [archaeon]|nr:protein kinase [archaeon]